ncbi:hypothetical protein [Kocuria palustris]|uniref:hypothetical protein n=1 Tax=Kocuria palustris TaxID=71999 RepID=UPI003D71BD80
MSGNETRLRKVIGESVEQFNQPLYATGSSVLFEGDVDRTWINNYEAGFPSGWTPGPLVFARRNGKSKPDLIDDNSRRERVGHGIARHTLDRTRRFHRRVAYTVRTGSPKREIREMQIVAFELILGEPDSSRVDPNESDRWTPAILVVHLALPHRISDSGDEISDLRFEHVGNLLARFFKWRATDCCHLLERFLTAETAEGTVLYEDGSFIAPTERSAESQPGPADRHVRLLASSAHESMASLPMYWILTDIAPGSQEDDDRWNRDIEFYEVGPGSPIGLTDCSSVERQERRSRVLSELEVRPWATENCGTPSAFGDSDPHAWRNWHVSFGRTGAGFAHSAQIQGGNDNRHRRDDLSTVYVDLIALEMLKDRIVQGFAEVTQDLATKTTSDQGFRNNCMSTWKALVSFSSQYFVRAAGISVHDREMIVQYSKGVGTDLDGELAKVQENLGRLAEAARIELESERNESDRNFNRIVGVLATVVIPFTVVPPLIEWFSPLPSRDAGLMAILWVLAIGAVIAVYLWWKLRRKDTAGPDSIGSGPIPKASGAAVNVDRDSPPGTPRRRRA